MINSSTIFGQQFSIFIILFYILGLLLVTMVAAIFHFYLRIVNHLPLGLFHLTICYLQLIVIISNSEFQDIKKTSHVTWFLSTGTSLIFTYWTHRATINNTPTSNTRGDILAWFFESLQEFINTIRTNLCIAFLKLGFLFISARDTYNPFMYRFWNILFLKQTNNIVKYKN